MVCLVEPVGKCYFRRLIEVLILVRQICFGYGHVTGAGGC